MSRTAIGSLVLGLIASVMFGIFPEPARSTPANAGANAATAPRHNTPANAPPKAKFTIGKDTTYVTGPVDKHGYIVVVFRCSDLECKDLNTQATTIMKSLPNEKFNEVKFISTPYQAMTPKVALLAWGKEQDMDQLDQQLITAFYKQNVDHGLENLP